MVKPEKKEKCYLKKMKRLEINSFNATIGKLRKINCLRIEKNAEVKLNVKDIGRKSESSDRQDINKRR